MKNQEGNVTMILLFAVGVVALIGAILIYGARENSDSAKAKESMDMALKVSTGLHAEIDNLRLSYVKAKADIDELRAAIAGHDKKIDWLEVKSNARAPAPVIPAKIHVTLDPIKSEISGSTVPIRIIHREMKRRTKIENTPKRKALREKVKTQINELSQ